MWPVAAACSDFSIVLAVDVAMNWTDSTDRGPEITSL